MVTGGQVYTQAHFRSGMERHSRFGATRRWSSVGGGVVESKLGMRWWWCEAGGEAGGEAGVRLGMRLVAEDHEPDPIDDPSGSQGQGCVTRGARGVTTIVTRIWDSRIAEKSSKHANT